MSTELRFEEKEMRMATLGEPACVPDLSGEIILQNTLRFRLGEEEEIYEGYGRVKNAYPYRQRNSYTRRLAMGKVKTAVLENRYLKAVFLTEYGGRLWELWDKEKDVNLLYTNDVLRFSNLAVRNAWFSGGVEWNLGVIGHTPFTTERMYVARIRDDKGNPVLRMYEYERIRNVTYQMDFWLEEDSRFLNCRMRVVNESAEVVPMYWWSNMAVPEYEGGKLIVPADEAYTCTDHEVYKVQIPMVDGVNITDYKKIPLSVDYFFDLPDQMPGRIFGAQEEEKRAVDRGLAPRYIANVDSNGCGLLQISTGRLRGRKLFSWGNGIASDRWQEFLTDQGGRYLEIQAGLGKTQYGCLPMAPNTAWEWLEQYGAVDVGKDVSLPHRERSIKLTERLAAEGIAARLEEKLAETREMALTRGELVQAGSGYGVLGIHGKGTAHLEFLDDEGVYTSWREFINGGRLQEPDPEVFPDAFFYEEETKRRLKEAVKGQEKHNWYAHYHLGLRYYQDGRYKKAKKEFQASLKLTENAWALHGLACVEVLQGEKEKAAVHILRGMELQKKERSYIKEGFRLLLFCEKYQEVCRFYESLDADVKEGGGQGPKTDGVRSQAVLREDSRIKFYYIRALSCVGREREAYELLEAGNGFVLDDIREGEDSLSAVWSELHEKLYQTKGEVPRCYRFDAFA